jgi:HEAT repeat protein
MGLLGQRKPNVRSLAQAEDLEALIEASRYTERVETPEGAIQDGGVATRAEAVLALGTLDRAPTHGALKQALTDPADPVRCAAVRVLHGRQEADALLEALPQLVAAQGKSPELARRALGSLRELTDPRVAAEALVRAEDDRELSDDDVAMLATLLGDEDSEPKAETISALVDALSDDRDAVVDRAADLLVWLAPASTDAVVERLGTDSAPPGVPWVLGRIADPRTVDVLVQGLEHENARVRAECAAGLGEIGDPLAVGALVRATRDADHSVRMQAASALDEFGTAAVIVGVAELLRPLVMEAAQSRRPSPTPRGKPNRKPTARPETTAHSGAARPRRPGEDGAVSEVRGVPASTYSSS